MPESTEPLRQIQTELMNDEQRRLLRRARFPLHILVVDDDVTTQQLIQKLLGQNYCVSLCSTVGQAVHDYLRIMPDLVFLDIQLGDSEFNGFDVAHTMCMYDDSANIVILTAHESAQNIANARRAGASGFMVKPFSASRILHYVQECERMKFSGERPLWS